MYGKGENMREWIYVVDHCEAILKVYRKGKAGQTYNIGTGVLYRNIDLVRNVLELLERKEDLIEFVEDRKGHDFIYAIDCSKTANEIDWQASIDFTEGLRRTIEWYKNYLDNAAPR